MSGAGDLKLGIEIMAVSPCNLLKGGANMGKHIRDKEWSDTPLGPIECCPTSLKIVVNLVLEHHFPMMVLWGDELIQIYNGGFRAIIGGKHPERLGQSVKACRPEMWNFNKPIFDRVRAGETVTLKDQPLIFERGETKEAARFTLCYSPFRNDSGAISGVLVTVLETTEQLKTEQALRKNEEKYRTLFESIDEGFCLIKMIFDENDNALDYRILETNGAFENHTDIKNAVGKRRSEIGPLEDTWFETLGKVALSRKPIRFERPVKAVDRFYEVYAFPHGEPDENMVAILFRDITPRKEAERALYESEKHLRLATRSAGMHLCEVDLANETLKWVVEVRHNVSFPMPQTVEEAERLLHPDDKKKVVDSLNRVADQDRGFEMEYRVVDPKTGAVIWVYSAGTAIGKEDGTYNKIISTTKNITERKRSEMRDQFLSRLSTKIHRIGNAEQIMAAAARMLGEYLNIHRCTYAEIADDENHYVIFGNYTRQDMQPMEGSGAMADFGEEFLRLMRQNKPFVSDNVARDERINQEQKAAFRESQISALVCVPLHKDGRFRVKVAAHQNEPRHWRSDEIELVQTVANRCWEAVERARVSRELQKMNEKLEERVEKRTKKLKNYQQELRSLASQLNKAEEQERHRLAGELHDYLAQMLAVAKIDLDSLRNLELPRDAEDQIADTHKLIDDALAFTRELMMELKPPPEIDRRDTVKIMNWVAQNMEKYGLNVTIQDDGQPKLLNKDTLAVLHQCVRELLFNAIKHAGVSEARIILSRTESEVSVTVEDHGGGIGPEQKEPTPTSEGGFGLFNIRERMNWLGGRLKIDSEPGQGTRATLYLPLINECRNHL